MTAATATTARAHHSAATHSPRLNDKGQPLPDDGTPFAQLLAGGLDDNSADATLTDPASTTTLGAKSLLGADTAPTGNAQTPDASTDAALAAWIGQTLAKHNGTALTDTPQDKTESDLSGTGKSPLAGLATSPNGTDATAVTDDKTSEAKGAANGHGAKRASGHLLGAANAASHGKAHDGLPAVASSTAQATITDCP